MRKRINYSGSREKRKIRIRNRGKKTTGYNMIIASCFLITHFGGFSFMSPSTLR